MREIYNIGNVKENNVTSLQNFIDNFRKHYNALQAMNINTDTWDLFLVHHLSLKLDIASRTEVESKSSADSILSVADFLKILTDRCRLMHAISESNSSAKSSRGIHHQINSRTLVTTSLICVGCLQANHEISKCDSFRKKNPEILFCNCYDMGT